MGIYNELLWIQLGGGILIALSIKTGKLAHTIENIEKGVGDIHLDIKKGVLKILAGHSYKEFDLNLLILTDKYKNKNLFFRSCNFYQGDDNLYFCGINNYPINTSYNTFGVFNTTKNEIVWLKEKQAD